MATIDHSKTMEFLITPTVDDEILEQEIPGCEGIQIRYIHAVSTVVELIGQAVGDI